MYTMVLSGTLVLDGMTKLQAKLATHGNNGQVCQIGTVRGTTFSHQLVTFLRLFLGDYSITLQFVDTFLVTLLLYNIFQLYLAA